MLPRRPAPLLALLAWLISLACAPLTGGTSTAVPSALPPTQAQVSATDAPPVETAEPTATAVETTATAEPVATNPSEIIIEGTAVFGSGPFNLLDPRAGLDSLSSYAATLTLTFDGTQNGAVLQTTRVYHLLASAQPAARQLTIDASAGGESQPSLWLASRDGVDYERHSDEPCLANASAPSDAPVDVMELASNLHSLIGADEAGAETVNGIAANHYTFDQRALGQDGQTVSTGELWVAAEGGYVVRYVLSSTAGPDYWGEGLDGTLTWDYALSDPNMPVEIVLPADCPPGLVDAPLPPDAANVDSQPGLLRYETASTPADVMALYTDGLPDLGWVLDGDTTVSDTGGNAQFVRAAQTLTLIIQVDAGVTQVSLLLRNNAE